MMDIFNGKCIHLKEVYRCDDLVTVSLSQWQQVHDEINAIRRGTGSSAFLDIHWNTAHYSNWKAAECIEFLSNFAMILFDGILPQPYLPNLYPLSQSAKLPRRPVLSQNHVDEMKQLGIDFVCGFESLYYRGHGRRVEVCKYTVHDVGHFCWMVEQCGPLVNYSQFWIERFISFIKHLLYATTLDAESMNETAKLTERAKIYFRYCFVSKDD